MVGPRPHPVFMKTAGHYNWDVIDTYWQRHSIKPSITGLAQVRGYRGQTEEVGDFTARVTSDLEYVNPWSFVLDLKILFRTIFVLADKKAY